MVVAIPFGFVSGEHAFTKWGDFGHEIVDRFAGRELGNSVPATVTVVHGKGDTVANFGIVFC